MNKKPILSVLAAVILLAPAVANASWSIKALGMLDGTASRVTGINNSGQVIGVISDNSPGSTDITRAFITDADGAGIRYLGALGGTDSYAADINDSGQVVGWANTSDNLYHAFITGSNGAGMTKLDFGHMNTTSSVAYGINNSGQVVGSYRDAEDIHDFITGTNGVGLKNFNALNGVADINNSGQVLGGLALTSARHAAIADSNGENITDLGSIIGFQNSGAREINDSGQVAGSVWNPYYNPDLEEELILTQHAFVTGANGAGMIDLTPLLGGDDTIATGINNSGQVVGRAYPEGVGYGFLYSGEAVINLSLLDTVISAGWTGIAPEAINDNGQIAGHGYLNGHIQAFLLTPSDISPVPEPSTFTMLLAGLGFLGIGGIRNAVINKATIA
ncbi:putative secreted protein with PEP-CTERM sorting signal [Nitrosomonas oligotropha]|uniref:Putative secreted protein with PEP-CTERM sorting signal n=1 Tax=Nitrosomonas oligotropha TaxID=42354 RepID=A0A2T5HZD7_9PROT|nr:HAF repeat-containing PEP-CTERM protein [Nitrosomonas oligotropha]PTQ76959.1 putative secreted protein with PEP-CTERM sorting signal [Nitrosomonas oligotropha]